MHELHGYGLHYSLHRGILDSEGIYEDGNPIVI